MTLPLWEYFPLKEICIFKEKVFSLKGLDEDINVKKFYWLYGFPV